MTKNQFLSRVEAVTESGCWIWMGATRNGYGMVNENTGRARPRQRPVGAHRVAYEMFKGSIPSDKCVCHTCDVPLCVNPAHLWLGTQDENQKDKAKKGRAPSGELNGAAVHRQLFQGEKNAAAVLSADDVRDIRASTLSRPALARKYGVTYCTIRNVLDRVTWNHL